MPAAILQTGSGSPLPSLRVRRRLRLLGALLN